MLYVPMFKNKKHEKKVIETFNNQFNNAIIPLIEVITRVNPWKTNENGKRARNEDGSYIKDLSKDYTIDEIIYATNGKKTFIDFYRFDSMKYENSYDAEKMKWSFLISRNWSTYRKCFEEVLKCDNLYPVVSLKHGQIVYDKDDVIILMEELKKQKSTVALRVTSEYYHYNSIFLDELIKDLRDSDFLMYDLHENSYSGYEDTIKKIFKDCNCTKIILNSPRKADLFNSSLDKGISIAPIENTLIYDFRSLSGDGFGDYAGVSDKLEISFNPKYAATLLYYFKENYFYSFKLNNALFSRLKHLVLSWDKIKSEQYRDCLGIKKVRELNKGGAGDWKEVTMLCYMSAMIKHITSHR